MQKHTGSVLGPLPSTSRALKQTLCVLSFCLPSGGALGKTALAQLGLDTYTFSRVSAKPSQPKPGRAWPSLAAWLATWLTQLAGWLAGWLASWLAVKEPPIVYNNKLDSYQI